MTTLKTDSPLVDWLKRDLASAEAEIASFAAKLNEDPLYALSWSDGVFMAAATAKVTKLVIFALQEDSSLGGLLALREHVSGQVLRKAQWPGSSSSVASNLADQKEMMAWAKMLDRVDSFIAFTKEEMKKG